MSHVQERSRLGRWRPDECGVGVALGATILLWSWLAPSAAWGEKLPMPELWHWDAPSCKVLKQQRTEVRETYYQAVTRWDVHTPIKPLLANTRAAVLGDLAAHTPQSLRHAAQRIRDLNVELARALGTVTPQGAVVDQSASANQRARELSNAIADALKHRGNGPIHVNPGLFGAIVEAAALGRGHLHIGAIAQAMGIMWRAADMLDSVMSVPAPQARIAGQQAVAQIDRLGGLIWYYQSSVQREIRVTKTVEVVYETVKRRLTEECDPRSCQIILRKAVEEEQEAQRRADALDAHAQQLRNQMPEILRPHDERIAKLEQRLWDLPDKAHAELDPLAQKIQELIAERDRALDELRHGMYCSKCKRPKSEIERQERVSFEQHLQNVKGTNLPATKEMIDAKADEYNHRIAQLILEWQRISARYEVEDRRLREELDRAKAERVRAYQKKRAEILRLEREADELEVAARERHDARKREAERCRIDLTW